MELRDIIAADKSQIKTGPWHKGKVPKADFPIAKQAYSLGNSFQWCVITFQALGAEIRVLVILNPAKEKYDAILGVMGPTGLRVMSSYQYHAGEPGCHCHATCDDAGKVPMGIFRGPWVKRIPLARGYHRRLDFEITDQTEAARFALDHYRIFERGTLL
jgi:hypothetical protein